MAKVELKNVKGEKLKDITISDSIWKIEGNSVNWLCPLNNN